MDIVETPSLIIGREKNPKPFEGTVIDIETIGDFSREYEKNDSRQYVNMKPTIIGVINRNVLEVVCAKGPTCLNHLVAHIISIYPTLQRPLFAFQSRFERGVLHHACGIQVEFEGEINAEQYEWKGTACRQLGISSYDDPFHDVGVECNKAWTRGDYDSAMKHNRSCLLKERDILLMRNYRKPDELRCLK